MAAKKATRPKTLAQNRPEKMAAETTPLPELKLKGVPDGFSRYRVQSNRTALSHGQDVFPVKDSLVDLPDSGLWWYRHLVAVGDLTKVED